MTNSSECYYPFPPEIIIPSPLRSSLSSRKETIWFQSLLGLMASQVALTVSKSVYCTNASIFYSCSRYWRMVVGTGRMQSREDETVSSSTLWCFEAPTFLSTGKRKKHHIFWSQEAVVIYKRPDQSIEERGRGWSIRVIALCAYPFFLSSAYKDDDTQILNLLVKMTSRYDGHHRAIHMMRNAQNYKEVDLILLIRVKGL